MSQRLKNALFKIASAVAIGFFLWFALTIIGVFK
jgi:hypothetical protein